MVYAICATFLSVILCYLWLIVLINTSCNSNSIRDYSQNIKKAQSHADLVVVDNYMVPNPEYVFSDSGFCFYLQSLDASAESYFVFVKSSINKKLFYIYKFSKGSFAGRVEPGNLNGDSIEWQRNGEMTVLGLTDKSYQEFLKNIQNIEHNDTAVGMVSINWRGEKGEWVKRDYGAATIPIVMKVLRRYQIY